MDNPRHTTRVLTRPFGLLDLMILVLASGPVLLLLRDSYDFYRQSPPPSTYRTARIVIAVANAILVGLTAAMTAFVLRRPRPGLRVVLRLPGPAACVAASVASIVMAIRWTAKCYSMSSGSGREFDILNFRVWLVDDLTRIGPAVLGAWLALLMTVGWRPEPSWLDRAGRVLGCGWLALALFDVLLPWIESFLPMI